VWVAEHGWVYLMAAIDCCTREIVAWHLETRCRALDAIGLVEGAVTERSIAPGTLTVGTDHGSAFTARAFKLVLSGRGVAHRRGGYRDPESQAFIESGSASSRNGSSGAPSSRRSSRPAPSWLPTSSTTTTARTAGLTTGRRPRWPRPGRMDRPT